MTSLFDLPFEPPDEEPEPPPAPAPRVWSVSALTAAIRELLEHRFADVWIEGEISNCRPWHTGHLYFTLKDEGAQIKAVMFRSAVRALRFRPEDGLGVLVRGRVGVYDPKGEYQVVCDQMEPQGLGALQLAFEQLKKRLQAEGLFDAARKRPLPALPRRIGIVTSLDGAALRDIIKVITRRHPNVSLVIRPARVQGEGAALEIARALQAVARQPGVDVVIVGRGGGSIEDLWAFNEEAVAAAVFESRLPIVSAVGHETDFTICDFVADERAATPTAAAARVVPDGAALRARLSAIASRWRRAAWTSLEPRMQHLDHVARRLVHPAARIERQTRDVQLLAARLAPAMRRTLATAEALPGQLRLRLALLAGRPLPQRGIVDRLRERWTQACRTRVEASSQRIETAGRALAHLGPQAVLARGYSIVTDDQGGVVSDAGAIERGSNVNLRFARGTATAQITGRRADD